MKSRDFWNIRARLPGLRAVIDENDEVGVKNQYLDALHKTALVKYLKLPKIQPTILDFGCGYGRFSFWLAHRGKSVFGIDISEEMIARARNSFNESNVHFDTYDGIQIPFGDEYFDLVVSVWVMQHIMHDSDLCITVQEIVRVLKQGGQLCIIERLSNSPTEPGMPKDSIKRRLARDYIKIFREHGMDCILSVPISLVPPENWLIGKLNRLIYHNKIPQVLFPLLAKVELEFHRWKGWNGAGYADYMFIFRKSA